MKGARKHRKKKVKKQKIAGAPPTWEEYQAAKAEYDAAHNLHSALLGFQARLDHYRQRLDSGDLTAEEVSAMNADFENTIDKPIKH
jgi:hypothetical protein